MLPGMAYSYDKVRDNRLRRMAERQDLRLRRSPRRDPLATDYGLYTLYDLLGQPTAAGLTMDQVENYLTRPRQKSPARTG